MWACGEKLEKVALRILEVKNLDLNAKGDYGKTALMYACEEKLEKVALRLLKMGATKDDESLSQLLVDVVSDQVGVNFFG